MLARYRHAQLLAALTLLLLVNPFLSGLVRLTIVDAFMIVTLISAILACATSRRHVVIGVSLAVAMQVALLVRALNGIVAAGHATSLLALAFFGYVTVLVLTNVFRDSRRVSSDTICGALSAYLLLGVFWAFVYAFLEGVSPGSFAGIDEGVGFTHYNRFIGYSFVTLTTLGYGNVHPLTPQADSLASAEAIVGQVYLTVLVARLVALNLIHAKDEA